MTEERSNATPVPPMVDTFFNISLCALARSAEAADRGDTHRLAREIDTFVTLSGQHDTNTWVYFFGKYISEQARIRVERTGRSATDIGRLRDLLSRSLEYLNGYAVLFPSHDTSELARAIFKELEG
jgi:hypothetical protein